MENTLSGAASNIIIENRKKMSVSGVLDVISFDDNSVLLETANGALNVVGENFRINKLNVDIGELTIDGDIAGFNYEDIQKKGAGFFSKMFK
jgi:sporulation protein YabP